MVQPGGGFTRCRAGIGKAVGYIETEKSTGGQSHTVLFSEISVSMVRDSLSAGDLSGLLGYATLLDTGFLAGETTEVVKLGTTHLTILVDGD